MSRSANIKQTKSTMAADNGDSADAVDGASPTPAHDPASTSAPAPPEGGPETTNPAEPETPGKPEESDKKSSAEDTVGTAVDDQEDPRPSAGGGAKPVAVVSSSKNARPPYRFDPDKITLRFLFAGRDGLTVTVECKPSDTVGEVKGALLSVWPDGKDLSRSVMIASFCICAKSQFVLLSQIFPIAKEGRHCDWFVWEKVS